MSNSTYSLLEQRKKIGNIIGPSKSVQITQKMIDQFAEATLDMDPMHIDPKWCKEQGPYPTTISFGFLTMSLMTSLAHNLLKYDRDGRIATGGFPLNYGFNKMRLISPVPVDSKISMTLKLIDVTQRKSGQLMLTMEVIISIDGQETPALVGEWLSIWVSEDGD